MTFIRAQVTNNRELDHSQNQSQFGWIVEENPVADV